MKFLTLSWYIKTIRKYSKNCRRSYQSILQKLFDLVLCNNEDYDVESTTSSRIMNGEYDVPYVFREKYNNASPEKKKYISDQFIIQMIDSSSMDMLIFEIKDFIVSTNISIKTKNIILNEDDAFKILSLILSIAVISSNKISLEKNLYNSTNGTIDLISGDIIAIGFNKKLAINDKIVVIPVDDKFTMIFKNQYGDDVISKDSLHGKWLLRINKLGIQNPKIKYEKTEFYLLPVSSLKKRYKAESGIEVIKSMLNLLASEYSISGQGVTIYVPLIGTGRSRAHLSLNDSISLIKESFLRNENGFFGKVKIVLYKKNINVWETLDVL
jgi:hypothetical protein